MSEPFAQARDEFLAGVEHFERGEWAAAERRFLASLALLPGRASTLANLGAVRLRLQRPADALEPLAAALAAEPAQPEAWCHHGDALLLLERPGDALASFEQAQAHAPGDDRVRYRRGKALAALDRPEEALAEFDAVLAQRPADAEAWLRRAQCLQQLDRHPAALEGYGRALALRPDLATAWSQRGSLLKDLGRHAEAARDFEQALAHGADPEVHRYFLAAVSGAGSPAHAPRQYVEFLFDDYAPRFDAHLVGLLGYRAHRVLVEGLADLGPRRYARALDLGCGTGLCGPLVRPLAGALDGVDLSARMLEQARATGCYADLLQADIAEHLAATAHRYELLLAADVFIYVGDLDAVFAGAARALAPCGVFCFSVEQAGDAEGVALRTSLRYAHGLHYLQALARRHGFAWRHQRSAPIREDQRQPIPGRYVYLERPGPAGAAGPADPAPADNAP